MTVFLSFLITIFKPPHHYNLYSPFHPMIVISQTIAPVSLDRRIKNEKKNNQFNKWKEFIGGELNPTFDRLAHIERNVRASGVYIVRRL